MKALRDLFDTLSGLKSVADEILELSVKIVKLSRDPSDDMIKFVTKEYPSLSTSALLDGLKLAGDELVKDAETVRKEVDAFADKIASNVHIGESDDDTFLAQVWRGDIYDKSGVDGLEHLLEEFDTNYTKMRSKPKTYLVDLARKHFSEKTKN